MCRLLIYITFILPVSGLAQGVVQLENYTPEEYENSRQNWAVIESDVGSIYFGNGGGLLHFNGHEWNAEHVPAGGSVRSLGIHNGKMFWGGNGDFGDVKADSLNRFYPVSLLERVDSSSHNFSSVWQFVNRDDKIFARTYEGLYIIEEDSVTTVPTNASLRSIFPFRNRLMTQITGNGLSFYNDGEFTKLTDIEIYNADVIYDTLPIDDNVLLLSRENGLVVYDGETFRPFEHEAADYINENRVYRAVPIGQNRAAIATLDGGIVIMNHDGDEYITITEDHGLPTNMIYDVYLDNEGILWAATDNGIAKLLVNNPVTVWGEQAGYSGATLFIGSIGNTVYAGTTEGLFSITPSSRLISSDLVTARVFDGIETESGLLISTGNGLLTIGAEEEKKISDKLYDMLATNPYIKDQYFGIRRNRVDLITIENEEIKTDTLLTIDVNISHLHVEEQNLWVARWDNIIYRFSSDGSLKDSYDIPVPESASLRKIGTLDGRIRLATTEGLFVFDRVNNQFLRDTTFNDPDIPTKDLSNFEQCSENEIWFRNNRLIKRAVRDGGKWTTITDPYRTIARDQSVEAIRCNEDGSAWFGGSRNLYHLSDPSWQYDHDFNTLITGAYAERDSLIYGGFGEQNRISELSYDENSLRFTYAAASYIDPDENSYRVRLRGFEDGWSSWSSEPRKDYTFITEGTYTFEVQGRNVYHAEGSVAAYTFKVLPPWYRTIWAYLFYALLAGGFIYSGYRLRLSTILREQRIRDGIARDLHDELSSTLSSINFFADAIDSKKLGKKDTNRFLTLIQRSSREAKEKISDIVWVIHSDNDDWENLLLRCKRFAADLLDSRSIKHTFNHSGTFSGKPSINERKNIWLIFREILTNIARHAEAKNVTIRMNLESDCLLIFVEDDGKGFDPEEIKVDGNGVQNIKERAGQLNGSASLQTKKEEGTIWEIEFQIM
ncbi:sensor histidine kinase [Rhodohalobacter sp. 8-1]|uniref:sensor histidine kinase n=1 Tax=Rhodohalobacter sp. 8-1 TaxID=3131972 RepID=UPI0030EC989F